MKYQKVSKEKIIEATASVIAREGLDKVTVDDISQEADVAKGSIYFHFDSKDKLLIEGIRYIAEQRVFRIRKALKNISSPKRKLIKLLAVSNLMIKKDPDSFLMNYALLLSSHKNIKREVSLEYVQKYILLVSEIIKDGIALRQFKQVNAEAVATSLVLTNDLAGILRFSEKQIPSPQKIYKELIKLISTRK
ncbi:TetR family transcriptional regulator [Candidatus Dojkabacteria bacterium]|nr:TetR family transcriptional regulator [Candidatus Dojkabacteria bacterium]